jgi:hypothetical protein
MMTTLTADDVKIDAIAAAAAGARTLLERDAQIFEQLAAKFREADARDRRGDRPAIRDLLALAAERRSAAERLRRAGA